MNYYIKFSRGRKEVKTNKRNSESESASESDRLEIFLHSCGRRKIGKTEDCFCGKTKKGKNFCTVQDTQLLLAWLCIRVPLYFVRETTGFRIPSSEQKTVTTKRYMEVLIIHCLDLRFKTLIWNCCTILYPDSILWIKPCTKNMYLLEQALVFDIYVKFLQLLPVSSIFSLFCPVLFCLLFYFMSSSTPCPQFFAHYFLHIHVHIKTLNKNNFYRHIFIVHLFMLCLGFWFFRLWGAVAFFSVRFIVYRKGNAQDSRQKKYNAKDNNNNT